MTRQKPNLIKNSKYNVELYPDEEILLSKYLGFSKNEKFHVFKSEDRESTYILIEDLWVHEEREVITYLPISSSGVEVHTKKSFENDCSKSRLLKILAEVGATSL